MRNRPLCTVCLILFLLMCVSIHAGKGRLIKELRPSPLERSAEDGDDILLTGRIYKKEIKEKYQILYLKNNSVYYQGRSLEESRIIVYDEKKTEYHIGQKVRAEGQVSFFEPAGNPGNFDRKLYYLRQDIRASVWASELRAADQERDIVADRLYGLRQRFRGVFGAYMPEEDAAVMSAVVLGEKGDMGEELKELYQVNGVGHILAISGLHLSVVGIGLYQLLRRLTGSYAAGGAAGIGFLLLYVLMVGFTVSAVRALVMFLFRVGADMAGRHYDSPTALSAAAVIVLIWRPLSIYDGGFWMSFGAVFAVITVLPVFDGMPLSGLWASVSINLTLLPVLLYYFYEFPTYSAVLNLIVIPLLSALLALGIGGVLLAGVTAAGRLMLLICSGILGIYEKSCRAALLLPGARIVAGQPEMWQIVTYYLCLTAAVLLARRYRSRERAEKEREGACSGERCRRAGRRTIWLFASIVTIFGIVLLTHRFGEAGELQVTVIDVGQGDGIFVKGPEGTTCLIDGGSSDVKSVGRYRIEPFLESQGVGRLDYVFLSHGDSDHMNGIEEMLGRQDVGVRIGTLVLPEESAWDESLAGIAAKAEEHGIRTAVMEAGRTLEESGLTITCIQPEADTDLSPGNAASMVLAVSYGRFDMLLTGDVEAEGETALTESLKAASGTAADRSFEVLKVAHHGSKNSTSEEFLDAVKPAYAVISAGTDNRYGHPHRETIDRLAGAGCVIYSTQENGAVMIETDGEKMGISGFATKK